MLLKELLNGIGYSVVCGSDDTTIKELCYDSRKASEGCVFVCIKGAGFDGHAFVQDVCEKGAAAVVVCEDVEAPEGVTVVRTDDTRLALAYMSANYFGNPAEKLVTIGITGTKGKTTTSYMVQAILEEAGIKTGLIGTIETVIGEKRTPALNTTPESFMIQQDMAEMVEAGCRCVVMEVSSQGLMLHRTSGFIFDYGIFTNLEPDHIGTNEHKDFEDYLHCKSLLFRQCRTGIINMDADYVERVLEGHTCEIETFGVNGDYDFTAKNVELLTGPGYLGVSYDLEGKISVPVEVHIPGMFSVYNSLCAAAICSHFTKDGALIADALRNTRVKGRGEIIAVSKRFTVMIDYAHNAMSLESILTSLKEYSPKRLVTIFGCGGNRSQSRRFDMGEVSSRLSDLTIVSSDNPRFEDPMAIIEDILVGVKKHDGEYVVVPDRKDAIRYALLNAQDGDVILLAGKGHEDYQEICGKKYPMDERVIIRELTEEDAVRKVL